MRVRARLAAACLSLLVLIGFASLDTAAAGKPTPFSFTNPTGGGQLDTTLELYNVFPYPIDQAQRVVNPIAGCPWDVNDHLDFRAGGTSAYLNPGASASVDQCQVEGFDPVYKSNDGQLAWWTHGQIAWFGTSIRAQSPKLNVSVCYSPQARCFTLSPIYNATARDYSYSLCSRVEYEGDPQDPILNIIPGSTPDPLPAGSVAGYGVKTTITLGVTNPTTRVVKGIDARWGISSDFYYPAGCQVDRSNPSISYPFSWVMP